MVHHKSKFNNRSSQRSTPPVAKERLLTLGLVLLALRSDEHVGYVEGVLGLHEVPQLGELLLRPHIKVPVPPVAAGGRGGDKVPRRRHVHRRHHRLRLRPASSITNSSI